MTNYKSVSALRSRLNGVHPSWACLKVTPSAEVEVVCLENPGAFSFDNLREILGFDSDTLLESVEAMNLSLFTDCHMMAYVDEEGLIKDLEYNELASFLVGQNIHGPAVFLNSELVLLIDRWGDEYVEYCFACGNEGSEAVGFYDWLATLPPELDDESQDGFFEDLTFDEAKELTTDPERA